MSNGLISKFFKQQPEPKTSDLSDAVTQLQLGLLPVSQRDLRAQSLGLLYQTTDIEVAGSSGTALTAGTIYANGVYLPAGFSFNNLVYRITTGAVGAVPTGMFFGLVDWNGIMVAQTPNLASSSLWTSTGLKEIALPYTVSDYEGGLYHVLSLQVGSFGTTQPSFLRASQWGGAGVNGVVAYGTAGTGQTQLPANGASVTISSASGNNFWIGLD